MSRYTCYFFIIKVPLLALIIDIIYNQGDICGKVTQISVLLVSKMWYIIKEIQTGIWPEKREQIMNVNDIEADAQKRQKRIQFINAAKELIDLEGFQNVSIRKIAQRAGFHNSTLYLYFQDLNQLLMLASMKYFGEYSHALNHLSHEARTPIEQFIKIWNYFFDTVLEEPLVFYNFFFGKDSDNLYNIMNTYYELFPEEREYFSDDIEIMYFGRNLTERSLHLLKILLSEDTAVTPDNLEILNEISVAYCKYKIEYKCQNPEADSALIKEEFRAAISCLFGLNL